MKKLSLAAFAAVGVLAVSGIAQAATTTIYMGPSSVPDEQLPRIANDAPAGWGADSWQGPATGKSNWHARYQADGDYLSALFGAQTAGLKVGDLASISYNTFRQTGTPAGRDWWVTIYTRPTGSGDGNPAFYHQKFNSDYGGHTVTGSWVEYSTDSGMTFGGMTLAALQASTGNSLIEAISVHTNSAWGGYDGYLDGLTITLKNGDVGRVDFGSTTAIPEPAFFQMGAFIGMSGLGLLRLRKRSA